MNARFQGFGILALPLAWIYGFGMCIHRGLYLSGICRQYQSPKPVVSIGNIVVGGVGKTPMTVWVVQFYLTRGLKPAVILRGYKSHHGMSDEAKLLQELLPNVLILTGANRQRSIEQALTKEKIDVFICDDAFQHWPLKRDLDIVLLDSTYPLGNRMLLPAGILREPVSALKRAGVVVISKSDDEKPAKYLIEQLSDVGYQATIVRARHCMNGLRDVFSGQPVDFQPQENIMAVCSIADPDSFKRTLVMMGVCVKEQIVFPDHEPYTKEMIERICDQTQKAGISSIITTHKDAVKMVAFKDKFESVRLLCVDIKMDVIQGKEDLEKKLLAVIHA